MKRHIIKVTCQVAARLRHQGAQSLKTGRRRMGRAMYTTASFQCLKQVYSKLLGL